MRSAPRPGMTEETRFANLGRVVRRWADSAADDPADQVAQWVALERSLSRSRSVWSSANPRRSDEGTGKANVGTPARTLSGLRWFAAGPGLIVTAAGAGAAMVVAAAALASLTIVRGRMKSDPSLTFVVSGAAAAAGRTAPQAGVRREEAARIGGGVQSSEVPARLSFSDGSNVVLQAGARGRVLSTSARGARVRVEQGRAHFAVAHLPHADWAVEAGPFVVLVHGTVFDVNWSPGTGTLTVELLAGSITVQGPAGETLATGAHAGGNVTNVARATVNSVSSVKMTAGQRLAARMTGGQAQLSVSEAPAAGQPLTNPSPAGRPEQTRMDRPPPTPVARSIQTTKPGAVAHANARGNRRSSHGQVVAATTPRRASDRSTRELAEVASSWEARVASGSFQGVITEAEALGVERCLKQAPVASLAALADAARYARRPELARRALLAERQRFEGSKAAQDAAFLLGRLAEDAFRDARQAVRWYDRYLAEAGQGTYAAEALGRKMLALDRLRESGGNGDNDGDNDTATGDRADARAAAEQYLAGYPDGPFAARARRIRASD